jgi:hypothetical protein
VCVPRNKEGITLESAVTVRRRHIKPNAVALPIHARDPRVQDDIVFASKDIGKPFCYLMILNRDEEGRHIDDCDLRP